MIGFDAAELTLVSQLMRDGRMPCLHSLAERGHFASLASPAAEFAGGVWPSFYCSRQVSRHGIYHNKLWRADAMRIDVPDGQWLDARPFWEHASAHGRRVCAIDVPMVIGEPHGVDGIYLGGWGTHDLIARGSWPEALWSDVQERFGKPLMPVEFFGRQTKESLSRLRRQLLDATDQLSDVVIDLLAREPWDLACLVFGASHRAGHYLWDLSQINGSQLPATERVLLEGALVEIYQAQDRALARVLDGRAGNVLVVVLALHGMAPNPGWADHFASIVDAMLAAGSNGAGTEAKKSLLFALKKRLPYHWARPVLSRLPVSVTNALVSVWSAGMYDWSTTRVFPLPMDHAGYLRINLKGRERDGIVEPGTDYDELCTALTRMIEGLRDAETGVPIAGEIIRAWQNAPAGAEARDLLPDLIVRWSDKRAMDVRRVVCDALPGFRYDLPSPLPSGRAGNHTPHGWAVFAGPGVEPGGSSSVHSIIDLAPTVMSYLRVSPDSAWDGTVMPLGNGMTSA